MHERLREDTPVGLTTEGCRARQERLCSILRARGLKAALIAQPRHVHYLTGFWYAGRPLFRSALLLDADGASRLFVPFTVENSVVGEVIEYEASRCATLVDDQDSALCDRLGSYLQSSGRVGFDRRGLAWALGERGISVAAEDDLSAAIMRLRRQKDADEVAILRHALSGCEAAYRRAAEVLQPGLREVDLYAEMLGAAVSRVGEPIIEFGNDFQCGSLGSLPRTRPVGAGEMVILDVSVVYRGYSADVCRTLVVGGEATAAQSEAHAKVLTALSYVEEHARPGASCREIYDHVFNSLDGHNGWRFSHHLGHGIGMAAHEAPRLNPHWDDHFQIGDAFTAEPGLYGDELRAGVRIEHNYLVTESGLECLSEFSVDLRPEAYVSA